MENQQKPTNKTALNYIVFLEKLIISVNYKFICR